jgi:hypothetical protein
MSKYKITDIKIGDGVYFKVLGQTNYDLYWEVLSINNGILEIEIDEMGAKDKNFLHINDVYSIEKRPK